MTDPTFRETELIKVVEKELPEFVTMCRDPAAPVVVMHQDAFAADYQEQEFKLLGMAIKFAGICDNEVRIIGKNRSTVAEPPTVR